MAYESNGTGPEHPQLVGQYSQRYPLLGARRRFDGWTAASSIHSLISDWSKMPLVSSSQPPNESQGLSRSKKLQLLGILSGFAAGAWLGAAEAPTKLVS